MHPKKCEECESGIQPPAKLGGKLWSREGKKEAKCRNRKNQVVPG